MENNFKFSKNDYVRVETDRYNVFNALVVARKAVNDVKMYKVNGSERWHFEENISKVNRPSMTPTDEEMKIIKSEYPILKKNEVKIIFEHGSNIFGFIYEKGEQKGKLRYTKGEFSVMTDKEARKYGYIF